MATPILVAKDVEKTYGVNTKSPFLALKDIQFTMYDGDFICVMGPSGAGKSTFINVMSTIDYPTAGTVTINGQETSSMTEEELGKFKYENLGFIFQDFNMVDSLTIFENIAVPVSLSKKSAKEISDSIHELAKRFDIEGILDNYPEECSGGQRQRAAIARALVNKPSLIIADEPTGNLDSENSHEILELFKQLNDDGTTILMVTHDNMIASYAKKLIFIKDGILEKTLDRNDMSQKEFYYRIVDITSKDSMKLFE